MGLLDKAKAAAEQAATRAKEGVEDVQTKLDLNKAYTELGKTTFELIEQGEVVNPKLDAVAAKIRGLKDEAAGDTAEAPVGATSDVS
jgi:hypothetical protein